MVHLCNIQRMFAFPCGTPACADYSSPATTLARNAYWGVFEKHMIFGLTKALLGPSGRCPRTQSAGPEAISLFDYVPAPLSIYQGIKSCRCSQLTLENGQIETAAYWRLSYQTKEPVPGEEEAAERLQNC